MPGQPVDRCISGIAPLDTAGSTDIAFLEDEKSLHQIAATHAGACFVASRFAASAPPPVAVLLNDEPYKAFVTTAQALFPDDIRPTSLFETAGRSADAHLHASSRIEAGVTIDPLAMIGPRAEVGTGTVLAAGVTLGPDVCVGRQCAIGAGATIMHALIGDGVVVQPGARIGHEGLGYRPDLKRQGRLFQCRRVIIQDDVQIGANAAVDRGSTRDTIIGEGTTIDNLVQIAHNAAIGRHCLIGAQAGIGGNVRVGDFVVIGRQSNVDDDSAIGDGIVLPERSWIRSDTSLGARSSSPSGRFGEGKA
ncbi:MAG: UDP-3-O-(3-hydroxymyristoyl)glucosamine N-acyltransferase [Xanthobacteraceae bacterium]